jgi:hypothetical protein
LNFFRCIHYLGIRPDKAANFEDVLERAGMAALTLSHLNPTDYFIYCRSLYGHEYTGWTVRVSNTGGGKRLFLKSSGLAPRPTEHFTELTQGPLPGGKEAGARS